MCKDHGVTLMIESEPATNSYNCQKSAEIVKYINNPIVSALYEPGNNQMIRLMSNIKQGELDITALVEDGMFEKKDILSC